jgi:hypothetical protein
MNHTRLVTLAGLVAALILTAGCPVTLAPKTAALAHVHEVYRDEFILLEGPNDLRATRTAASSAAFARSLNAIHDYRLAYPGDVQELAHLQVLEGMIYLQSGRFGLAAAVKNDVAAAGQKLTSALGAGKGGSSADPNGRGKLVRDSLFAQNYSALLDGWNQTRSPSQRVEALEAAADELANNLKALSPQQRPEIERDGGALYLATSAAIFYTWASAREGELNFASNPERKAELAAKKKARDAKARAIIGEFLTPAEKAADISQDINGVPQGRLRYVLWYHYFDPVKTSPP